MQAFRFLHFVKKQVQHAIKIEKAIESGQPDCLTDKPICEAAAGLSWDGSEITLPIRFELSNPRESMAVLTLTHAKGGSTRVC